MNFPDSLQWLNEEEAGAAWLSRLPGLLDECAEQWDLDVGQPYEGGNVSYVTPATQHAEPVVLKLQFPHEECRFEADALELWNGHGAVRLLAHDRSRSAMLLERLSPGTHLSRAGLDDPLAEVITLLPKIWKPAGAPFKSLAEEAGAWREGLWRVWESAGRPCERSLVERTFELIAELLAEPGEQVLVHQDLHGDNILFSDRRGWLAIDPKPLRGEREFSLSPVIRSFEFGPTRADLLDRLDRLCAAFSLDRERARQWALVQAVCWSFGSAFADRHYQTARWLLDA